jgi:glycine/D-amino acid oxidase-like deaminating enzyme
VHAAPSVGRLPGHPSLRTVGVHCHSYADGGGMGCGTPEQIGFGPQLHSPSGYAQALSKLQWPAACAYVAGQPDFAASDEAGAAAGSASGLGRAVADVQAQVTRHARNAARDMRSAYHRAPMQVIVVGAGIFGVSASLALAERGHAVRLLDPGPLPHPLAESTDISKVVRMDYGGDDDYLGLMHGALAGWRRWNERWGEELFHETGVAFLSRQPLAPGGFEHASLERLAARSIPTKRLDASAIGSLFPALRPGAFVDGYLNPQGGFAESAKVVSRLLDDARAAGVSVRSGERVLHLIAIGPRIAGVVTWRREMLEADCVVVAAGSWTRELVPELAPCFRTVGQPVFHLAGTFPGPVACLDIARTGWYAFPTHAGVVKIANHGVGRAMDPGSSARAVTGDEERAMKAFLADAMPALAAAPIAHRRICVYCDTLDEHFWIARDPFREGLVVASGGSGHGFKFAPVIGEIIAAATLGEPHPLARKFRWRPEIAPRGEEAARGRV